MAEHHIGSLVKVDCGPVLGTYQGRVINVEPVLQTITLDNPLRCGVAYPVPKVTLHARDISNLTVLKLANDCNGSIGETLVKIHQDRAKTLSPGDVKRNNVKKLLKSFHIADGHVDTTNGTHYNESPRNGEKEKLKTRLSPPFNDNEKRVARRRRSNSGDIPHRYQKTPNGSTDVDLVKPIDYKIMATDFDFEANLAMFTKLPRSANTPSTAAKQAKNLEKLLNGVKGKEKNVPHDQFVVNDPSSVYINAKRSWRYMTGENVEVPSLSGLEKQLLFKNAVSSGLINQFTFASLMAQSSVQMFIDKTQEDNCSVSSTSTICILTANDETSVLIRKYLSRCFVNRQRRVIWLNKVDGAEPGVRTTIENTDNALCVFVIGCYDLNSEVGTTISDKLGLLMFVESDWQTGATGCWKMPIGYRKCSHVLMQFWQLPCDEVASQPNISSSSVCICDVNLPNQFIEQQLVITGLQQRVRTYKNPFGASVNVSLRRL